MEACIYGLDVAAILDDYAINTYKNVLFKVIQDGECDNMCIAEVYILAKWTIESYTIIIARFWSK